MLLLAARNILQSNVDKHEPVKLSQKKMAKMAKKMKLKSKRD